MKISIQLEPYEQVEFIHFGLDSKFVLFHKSRFITEKFVASRRAFKDFALDFLRNFVENYQSDSALDITATVRLVDASKVPVKVLETHTLNRDPIAAASK